MGEVAPSTIIPIKKSTIRRIMTSVATAPVAPSFLPYQSAAAPMDAATWQQQQFLQWQQFRQWQQQQQQSATSSPMTPPVTTGATPATTAEVPAFGNALSQPVPNTMTATPSRANDKETSASANPTAATTTTSNNANTNSTNVLDQLSAMLSALSTGLNSVQSNGSSLWKSVATTGQQMLPLFKVCQSCSAAAR
jgi:Ni/Co efflux regulator RcnB